MLEIDGVRHEMERLVWESGDYISDEYLILIDLSTSPERTNPSNAERIASAVRRLNRNLDTTSALLVETKVPWAYDDAEKFADAADVYDHVIGQVNAINEDMPNVGALLPMNRDESRFAGSSGSFRWAV